MKKVPRGRPLKYGRPARVVAMTLPEDTIAALQQIDSDLGRAVVTLANAFAAPSELDDRPIVDYERVGRRRSLIVVDREAVQGVPGCDLIPLSEQRAFLAMKDGRGLQDLELAILDRLADSGLTAKNREALEALRRTLAQCRRAPDVSVELRSIFVVEKSPRSR